MHDWPPYSALGVCAVAVGIVLILSGLADGLNTSLVPKMAGGLALIVGGLLPFHEDD